MTTDDRQIYEQSYALFRDEAPELLQKVEQGLLELDNNTDRGLLQELMRATHTLKGASANVGLNGLKGLAHHMEDVFRALMSPEAEIDEEIQNLLFESYECLRLVLSDQLQEGQAPDALISQRSAQIFAQLKERLQHCWDYDPMQLTSAELGVDLTKSIFEVGVQQRLDQLAVTLAAGGNPMEIVGGLQEQFEVFIGLAESLSLPGFKAIAEAAMKATSQHPQQSLEIGRLALESLQQGRNAVLAGDRERGGEPSPGLLALAEPPGWRETPPEPPTGAPTPPSEPLPAAASDAVAAGSDLEAAFGAFAAAPESAEEPMPSLDEAFGAFAMAEAEAADADEAASEGSANLDAAFGGFGSAAPGLEAAFDSADVAETAPEIARDRTPTPADSADPDAAADDGTDELDLALQALAAEPVLDVEPAFEDAAGATQLQPRPSAGGTAAALPPAVPATVVPTDDRGPDLPAPDNGRSAAAALPPAAPASAPPRPLPPPPIPVASQPARTPDFETQKIRQQQTQESAAARPRGKTPIRVDLEQLEHLSHLVNELAIEQNQLSLRDERFRDAVGKLNRWLKAHRHTLTHLQADLPYEVRAQLPESYYAALEEVSQLEQAAGDVQMLSRTTAATVERERRLTQQLQDRLEEARMVPVEKVFSRFPPMVEQLKRRYRKDVRLEMQGLQVPIDKTIAEGLYDALLHLVRNAFDHGIESAAVRQQQGKPAAGKIALRAYIQGNRTNLEVSDDGGGLDTEKICQRALDSGQISPAQAEAIRSDVNPANRLLQILCRPGFSTAERVTDLSGRGVGLDVVYTQVRDLGGMLYASSQLGGGTTFSLQIRGALLNARLLICQAGEQAYAFVSDEIAQVTIPDPTRIKWLGTQKVMRWQERVDREPISVPLYSLTELLPCRPPLSDPSTDVDATGERINNLLSADGKTAPVLLLRDSRTGGFVGIEVSAVVEEQELAIKPLTDAIAPPTYVYGCTTLADGRLSLAIDGLALLDYADKQLGSLTVASSVGTPRPVLTAPPIAAVDAATEPFANPLATDATNPYGRFGSGVAPDAGRTAVAAAPVEPPPAPVARHTLLVADDSIVERRTLTAILQKAGFRVLQAQDGREALELLQNDRSIDLLVSDLEMPNLNGLELLGLKNQTPSLAKIPTIVLTSRTRDKYQRVALGLGARAYLTKPYLDRELLGAIESALAETQRP